MSGLFFLALVFVIISKKQLSFEFVEQQLFHFLNLFSRLFVLLHPFSFLLIVNIPLSIRALMEGLLEKVVDSSFEDGEGIFILILDGLVIVLLILFIRGFLVLLRILLE